MDDINKIADWISEDLGSATCEECGNELAPGSDKCTTPGCRNFLLAFRNVPGWLITKRDVKIEFDDIIDEGNYYAVFVRSPLTYIGGNGCPYYWRNHFKYFKYRRAKPLWPNPKNPKGRAGGGAYTISRTHKTLTIHKENIQQLVIGNQEIEPKRKDPPYNPEDRGF